MAAQPLPEELLAELRVKFSRYSTSVDDAPRLINCSGWKFLLKSCPNKQLSDVAEERLEELFLGVAGPGSTKRSSKLGFDAFLSLLKALGHEIYDDSEASLLCLVLQCLLPHKMAEPQYRSMLDNLPSSTASSSSSSSALSPSVGAHRDARGIYVPGSGSASGAPTPSSRTLSTSPPSTGAWAAASLAALVPSTTTTTTTTTAAAAPAAASPAAAQGASSPADQHTLEAFLEAARLSEFAAPLRQLGATSVRDLAELTALDFNRLGMRDLQRRRLKEALAHGSSSSSGYATSPSATSDPQRNGSSSVSSSAATAAAAATTETAAAAAATYSGAAAGTGLLPVEDWDEYENADGYLYYHNRATGVTMWERPPAGPTVALHTIAERGVELINAAHGLDAAPGPAARGRSSSSSSSAKGATSSDVWQRMYNSEARVGSGRQSQQRQQQEPEAEEEEVILPSDRVRMELARRSASAAAGSARPTPSPFFAPNGDLRLYGHEQGFEGSAQDLRERAGYGAVDHDTSFQRRGPIVTASTQPYVNSLSRSVMEERAAALAEAQWEQHPHTQRQAGGTAAAYPQSAPQSSLGAHAAVLLAPSQLAPRPTSSSVYRELVTEGGGGRGLPASQVYRDVLERLPDMHPATAEVLARSHSVANPRIMGYADLRPDITPRGGLSGALGRVNSDHRGERSMFTESGSGGVAAGRWASGLRPQLYTPSKDPTGSPSRGGGGGGGGGALGSSGSGSFGGGGAAIDAAASASYAYKHAAAASQWAGAGSVYDRLCDPRGYTGLHKHRFDVDGRGKGMGGRDETGTSADMSYIAASFPADVRVRGDDGKVRVIAGNATPWTLEIPGYSGFGTARGMGRKGGKGSAF